MFVLFYYKAIYLIWNEEKAKKMFFILLTSHLILFRALANPYNYVDTLVYAQAFDNIISMPIWEVFSLKNYYVDWGIGYVIFNWLIGHISHDPQILFISMAIISIIPVTWFIYKTSHSMLFPIVIYLLYPMFFYMGFGVMRQHAAIGFILLALYYVDDIKVSLFWGLLALSFHTSAAVFFPFYVWRYMNFNIRNVWKSLFFIAIVAIFLKTLLGSILMSLERYQHLYGVSGKENNIVPVVFIGSFLFLLWFTKLYKRINCPMDSNIVNFMIYGLALAIVGIGTYGMGRMTLYFMYVLPMAVTLLDKYKINVQLTSTYKVMLLCLVTYFLVSSYSVRPYAYSFYWESVVRTW